MAFCSKDLIGSVLALLGKLSQQKRKEKKLRVGRTSWASRPRLSTPPEWFRTKSLYVASWIGWAGIFWWWWVEWVIAKLFAHKSTQTGSVSDPDMSDCYIQSEQHNHDSWQVTNFEAGSVLVPMWPYRLWSILVLFWHIFSCSEEWKTEGEECWSRVVQFMLDTCIGLWIRRRSTSQTSRSTGPAQPALENAELSVPHTQPRRHVNLWPETPQVVACGLAVVQSVVLDCLPPIPP